MHGNPFKRLAIALDRPPRLRELLPFGALTLRQPVSSSAVVSVGYSRWRRVLEIEYQGGRLYQYRRVPQPVYTMLLDSDSIGRFVNAHVKGRFAYKQLKRS